MSGLLSLLTGAADELDFLPGFDPRKDHKGLISRLLTGSNQPVNPNGLHGPMGPGASPQPQRNIGDIMQIMSQPAAPGGATPQNAFAQYEKPRSFTSRLFSDHASNRRHDAGHLKFLEAQQNQFTAQQAQAAAAQQRTRRTNDATQYGLSGRDALSFINSGEVPDAKVVNSGDSVFANGGFQQAPGTFSAETDALDRPVSFLNTTGEFGAPQGPAKAISLSDGAQMRDPLTGALIADNPKDQTGPLVQNVLPGGNQFKPIDQYGADEWISPSHPALKGVEIPSGSQIYGNPGGNMPFRFEVAPGTPEAAKEEMKNSNRTVGSMISSYATLYKNNAISSIRRGNNIPAMVAGTGVGQFYDELGSDFGGNPENKTARDQLEGLRMGALMNMISMSDVSARAMDSDAEMKAWLSAIEGDVYESALLKLHVLDSAYGSGTELDKALADGVIDKETHDYVMSQVRNDPGLQSKIDKTQVLARVDRAVSEGRLTVDEARDLLTLEGWGFDENTWNNWTPGAAQ